MIVWLVAMMLAMLLSACGGGDSGGSDGPIKIGAIFDITGPTSDVGKPYSEGIKAFIQWKNENAKIVVDCLKKNFPNHKIIITDRSDLVAQFESVLRARQTGQWHSWKSQKNKASPTENS